MIEYYETTFDMNSKRKADMEAILFGEEDCAPRHSYGPTLRPYHLFHFITRGSGILEIGGKRYEMSKGDAFLIPAEQMSYYEASGTDPWSYSWAGMTGLRADRMIRRILAKVPEQYVLRNLDTDRYADLIRRAAYLEGTNSANYYLSESILYGIFSLLAAEVPGLDRTQGTTSLAERIKFWIDAKYMEKIRIDELAAGFGIHPNHLSRLFQQTYGISPKQYLKKLKLEKAALMLETGDSPVALIAESMGFDDQHAFSRSFRKYYAMSPTEYRNQRKRQAALA